MTLALALVVGAAGCASDDDAGRSPDGPPVESTSVSAASVDSAGGSAGDPADEGPVTDASFPRTIEHEGGTTEIVEAPERIVAASVSLTGNLLAIDAPVVASGATQPDSPVGDPQGFFRQWGDVATERGVVPLAGPTVDVEEVLAQDPDLIIGTSNGADAIVEIYDQLSEIAPTIMIDASDQSWDEVATELAAAIGSEEQAAGAIETFEQLVADTREEIGTAEHGAAAMVSNPDGINMFTSVSAHGQLLTALGFEVAEPGSSGSVEGGDRSDVAALSLELLPDVVGDDSIFLVYADEDAQAAFVSDPVVAAMPAAIDGRVHPLGFDSFRLDYYSATAVVERIADFLGS